MNFVDNYVATKQEVAVPSLESDFSRGFYVLAIFKPLPMLTSERICSANISSNVVILIMT
uniref:Uncharacterized protein n=1 Tax=Onchocerca volvulus TaxID=6282 RepID=A0A8R1XRE8_ONCVO